MIPTTMIATHQFANATPSRPASASSPSLQRLRIVLGTLWLSIACTSQASMPAPASATMAQDLAPLQLKMLLQMRPTVAALESVGVRPAPAPDGGLRTWVEQQRRLYRVAAPLLLENSELCKERARPLPGLTVKNKHSYSRDYVASASFILGLGERLRVMDVLPGSGAEQSGVRPGDIVTAVNGEPLPLGIYAEQSALAMLDIAMATNMLTFDVVRENTRLTLQTPLSQGCALSIELGNADDVNSYTDGHRVLITQGMLKFVRSDEELAYVLAKEIAHAALTRNPRPRMAALIDRLRLPGPPPSLPAADRPAPYTPVLDATADKLSLYMLARAGYDYAGALDFWQTLAARYPAGLLSGHTALHPSTAYRVSVMTRVIEHIQDKQRLRRRLIP